jgi:hypothetical protein
LGGWRVRLERCRAVSRMVLATILALACCACTGRPLQGVLVPAAQSSAGASRIPILVATTRQRSITDPGDMFSGDPAQELSYASITVSIPPDSARKIGKVQWPTAVPGDPGRDFVTASAEYLDKQSFNTAISTVAKSTGRSRVLVFVHGFNNRFGASNEAHFFSTTLSLLCLGSALAADLPPAPAPRAPAAYVPAPPPPYNWSGIYVGINGGWAAGTVKYTNNFNGFSGSQSDNGGGVGGTLGANWQINAFVSGVEGDWDWSGVSNNQYALRQHWYVPNGQHLVQHSARASWRRVG